MRFELRSSMLKKIISISLLLACIATPLMAKNSKKNEQISQKVYLRIKNKSTRTLQIKEGLFLKTTKILQPEESFIQYQVNSTISNLQISYKKNGRFIKIPDNHCQSKFFLATYETSVKEDKCNVPDEEDGHINRNIPPFCELSKSTQKYFHNQ